MAPDQAAYYVARARADVANKQPDAVLADLDKSLSLDPENLDALLMRAELRGLLKDHTGAASDVAAASALAPAGSTQAYSTATVPPATKLQACVSRRFRALRYGRSAG